jgi:hypothetical protein
MSRACSQQVLVAGRFSATDPRTEVLLWRTAVRETRSTRLRIRLRGPRWRPRQQRRETTTRPTTTSTPPTPRPGLARRRPPGRLSARSTAHHLTRRQSAGSRRARSVICASEYHPLLGTPQRRHSTVPRCCRRSRATRSRRRSGAPILGGTALTARTPRRPRILATTNVGVIPRPTRSERHPSIRRGCVVKPAGR